MGTRSNIGATQEDGTIKVIYCHWDGYPEGVGAVLTEHYTEPAKVQALLNLGDISSLNDTEVENVESYAKRGETDTEARIYSTREEWLKDIEDSGVEFLTYSRTVMEADTSGIISRISSLDITKKNRAGGKCLKATTITQSRSTLTDKKEN
jgi:hypothetical protein